VKPTDNKEDDDVEYVGTSIFCSRQAMTPTSISAWDDYESLIYTVFFVENGKLPWLHLTDFYKIKAAKEIFVSHIEQAFKGYSDNFRDFSAAVIARNDLKFKEMRNRYMDYVKKDLLTHAYLKRSEI